MAVEPKFIHLRNHTEYSICLGAIKIKKMIAKAQEYGMPAVAITDTKNMCGALEYSCDASKNGIQPIIGIELLVEAKGYFEKEEGDPYGEKNFCKIVLLAATDEGFYNIVALDRITIIVN